MEDIEISEPTSLRSTQLRTLQLLEYPRILKELSQWALSPGGKEACLKLKPLSDISLLSQQNELLKQALKTSRQILNCLNSFPELEGVFHHLQQGKILDEDGIWALGYLFNTASKAQRELSALESENVPQLHELVQSIYWPDKSWRGINRCLDENGEIRDESSPELFNIKQEIRNLQKQCTKKIEEYIQEPRLSEYLQDDYLTVSADRYVLALKTNFKGRLSGIIHDYSQSGETCYFEPLALVDLNNKLQELRKLEWEAKRRVLAYLTDLIRQEENLVYQVYNWLVNLDVLRAKVVMAEEFDGLTLEIGDDLPVFLKQVKHPLLLREKKDVQAVDIELKPEHKGLIISGGNSGGKTICLKALGLVALMGLTALPVPVQEGSCIPHFKDIFVFLGDEQSIQEHLSTFTAQIEHFSAAFEKMDVHSLVLLDEFGSGTDPSQGAALAQAVIDSLLEKGAWIAAATHFPALKVYALAEPSVRAASVLFDPQTNLPLYKLAYDQVGASQALDVAKEYGLPEKILAKAEEYLLLDGSDSSGLLRRLNELAVQRESQIEELNQERKELAREEEKLRQKYKQELENLITEVKEYSRKIVKEWKENKIGRKQALKSLEEQRRQLESNLSEPKKKNGQKLWSSLQKGDIIFYPPWQKNGTILQKDDKKERLKVDLGGVSLWIQADEVALPERRSEPENRASYYQGKQAMSSIYLDLRGKHIEEARSELDNFLDKALMQGRKEIEIIHGRGTGALRDMVHEFLKNFSSIKSYYLAPEDKGGDGVTLVDLG